MVPDHTWLIVVVDNGFEVHGKHFDWILNDNLGRILETLVWATFRSWTHILVACWWWWMVLCMVRWLLEYWQRSIEMLMKMELMDVASHVEEKENKNTIDKNKLTCWRSAPNKIKIKRKNKNNYSWQVGSEKFMKNQYKYTVIPHLNKYTQLWFSTSFEEFRVYK